MIKIIKAFLSAGFVSMALIVAILLLQGTCNAQTVKSVVQGQNFAHQGLYANLQAHAIHQERL